MGENRCYIEGDHKIWIWNAHLGQVSVNTGSEVGALSGRGAAIN